MMLAPLFSQVVPYAEVKVEWLTHMSAKERNRVRTSYRHGLPDGIGHSKAAINMHESVGGRWRIRLGEDAFGDHHLRVYFIAKEIAQAKAQKAAIILGKKLNSDALDKIEPSIWLQSRIAERILDEPLYDQELTTAKIQQLQDRFGKEAWTKIWAHYNGDPIGYPKDIRSRIHFFYKSGVLDEPDEIETDPEQ
jgi:hypothetical protein